MMFFTSNIALLLPWWKVRPTAPVRCSMQKRRNKTFVLCFRVFWPCDSIKWFVVWKALVDVFDCFLLFCCRLYCRSVLIGDSWPVFADFFVCLWITLWFWKFKQWLSSLLSILLVNWFVKSINQVVEHWFYIDFFIRSTFPKDMAWL